MSATLTVGQNTLTGKPVSVDPKRLRSHTLVVGGTGRGKSKLMELMIRHHLKSGHGMLILDPHGYLYEDVLAYASDAGLKNRLVLVNPNDTSYSVGLNVLNRPGVEDTVLAGRVMRAIAKVFGEGGEDVKPRLERWERNTLLAMVAANLTVVDMLDFLSSTGMQYRQAVLNRVSNPYVRNEWRSFDLVQKTAEKDNLIESVRNRAVKLTLPISMRRIMGQVESTVDIGEAVESGKVILVNLAPVRVSRECQQVLGILLADAIVSYALQRPKAKAQRDFFVFVDEASELTTDDLPYSLVALRKFGIFFTLCYQTLAQIRAIPGYCEAVLADCDTKIAFKCSREDSEELIGELFAGQIHGNRVKNEIHRTMLIPVETVRQIVSSGVSESRGESISESGGESLGEGSGLSSTSSSGSGSAELLVPGSGLLDSDTLSGTSVSSFSGGGSGSMNFTSSGSFSGRSSARSTSRTTSSSRTTVPFYEYVREQELSSRQYYSIEEIKEKYIAWVMTQPQRHAQLKLGDDRAIPILVAGVKEARVRDKDKQKVIDHSNTKYALPAFEVDRMIEERRQNLLVGSIASAEAEEREIEAGRWQKPPAPKTNRRSA